VILKCKPFVSFQPFLLLAKFCEDAKLQNFQMN